MIKTKYYRIFAFLTLMYYIGGTAGLKAIENHSFVTCTLNGQLGNQMFQVAATLAYAWDHGALPLFPELNRTDMNIPLNRKKIFFRLDRAPLPRGIKHTIDQSAPFKWIFLRPYHDLNLNGLFQSWRYFDHYRERILHIFSPSQKTQEHLYSKHSALLSHPMTVSIHVRTFNKAWHDNAIPFLGMDYYLEAIQKFPEDALFVVFSDRINWCKHHFAAIDRNIVFIEDQDHVDDLFLMSMMKHNIIGNSTFSWWAAYLNQNANKLVIAPLYFVHKSIKQAYGGELHANMPEWTVLQHNPNHPYPTDMYDYDAQSRSIDTQ